jgi:hypothetical protein
MLPFLKKNFAAILALDLSPPSTEDSTAIEIERQYVRNINKEHLIGALLN